jgi:hypothetical protein
MKVQSNKPIRDRANEKGSAMVMALIVSFLLLVASAGLIMESSMNTQNVTDSTTEQQAYNAAESGIQSAVNVLRGNVVPNPLLDPSKPATDPANKINYVRALSLTDSNLSGDASTYPRLSGWLGYDGTCTERVIIGALTCNTQNGYGYSLSISDPDNPSGTVSYSTTGRLFDNDGGDVAKKSYGTAPNRVVVKYHPVTVTNLNAGTNPVATNFGRFQVNITGTGASIPAFNRFEIIIQMTRPYSARRVIRGYIESSNRTNAQAPMIIFDAQTVTLKGGAMRLNFTWPTLPAPANVAILGPPQRYGYEARLDSGDNILTGTITAPEPTRLLLKSTGYGPRGSEKRLEAIIQKDRFDGLTAPATLTLVGPQTTTSPATTFNFNPGTSAATVYSGVDAVSTDIVPPIGTTDDLNLETVQESVDGLGEHPFNGTVIGVPSDISPEIPDWLASPLALDLTVKSLATVAQSSGTFYTNGQQPPSFGNSVTGQGITFCDGDCRLDGRGGGILIVTGALTVHGGFTFNGLIIITGPGGMLRSGGGGGTVQGNVVIAPYVGSRIQDGIDPTLTSTFLAPQYDLSGGGNSTLVYNSTVTTASLAAVSNFVLGVVEK